MQHIQNEAGSAHWNNDLLRDIIFIKKHLRYPFSKKTLPVTLVAAMLLLLLLRLASLVFLVEHKTTNLLQWLLVPIIVLTIIGSLYRYYRTLQFRSIPTTCFVAENMKLIEQFLQSEHLALYRHPDAPEIYQIQSRPVGNPAKDQREVMIFIADDRRILINSHFINQKYSIIPASGNAGKMANKLAEWINTHYTNNMSGITLEPMTL